MPNLGKMIDFWSDLPEALEVSFPSNRAFRIGWGEPFCFGCGYLADVPDYGTVRDVMFGEAELDDDQKRAVLLRTWNAAAGVLERAHLVDSALGGTNDPANLVPLCVVCHREMTDHCSTESKKAAARFIEELPDYSTRALSGAPR